MPSVKSSSMPKVFDSSTVTVPSLPTLSRASARTSPTARSPAEMEATLAMSSLSSTSLAIALMASTAAATALSMPRLRAMGLAPAATLRMPSWTRAWASTVAVVVPSPATSLVLVATSLTSWAPMFSKGSSSSMSRAMVTPSLVTVGAPNFLSSTTLRPLGPSVTFTASASLSTPVLSERRADSENSNCLATSYLQYLSILAAITGTVGSGLGGACRLDDRQDIFLAHDKQVFTVDLDLGAGILGIEHLGALAHLNGCALAVIADPSGADCQHRAALRLLFRRIGQDHATGRHLFPLGGANHDAIAQRLDVDLGRGCQRWYLLVFQIL